MTKEQTIEAIKIMQAFVDGKEIEHFSFPSKWSLCEEPDWDCGNNIINTYRIKPKPEYKPYKKVNPEWLGKGVKNKDNNCIHVIIGIDTSELSSYCLRFDSQWHSLDYLFDHNTWLDGTPCGEAV